MTICVTLSPCLSSPISSLLVSSIIAAVFIIECKSPSSCEFPRRNDIFGTYVTYRDHRQETAVEGDPCMCYSCSTCASAKYAFDLQASI